jgi:hypothetical protein
MDNALIVATVIKHLAGQHDQAAHTGKRRAGKKPHPWIAGLHVVGKEGRLRQAKLAVKYSGKTLTPEDKRHIKAQIRGTRSMTSTAQQYQPPAQEPLSSVIARGLINYAIQNPEDIHAVFGAAGGGAKKVWKKIDDPENRVTWTENERQAARKQRFWHPDTAADLDMRFRPQFYSGS